MQSLNPISNSFKTGCYLILLLILFSPAALARNNPAYSIVVIDTLFKANSGNVQLDEITVTGQSGRNGRMGSSLMSSTVDKNFIQMNTAGSLMQTLNRIPGVGSMDIGAGHSKPVIRGLGFNRVVVTENGIKHEAQEWGADHGLEIDQFTIENIEVIKGPASLMYGANAIGGVINLSQLTAPAKNSAGGSILFNMHTNNNLYGTSAKFHKRFDRFYLKAHVTLNDYADYRVPTDSIAYMTYYFRLKDNRLRNTAGKEQNGSITLGYLADYLTIHLSVSDNFSKSGFFANAHGLEIRNSTIDYDRSNRDIDLPYQQVNHFKILSNSMLMMKDYKLNIDVGFQHNYRQEFSEAVAHGYMPVPPDSLERLYDKNTLTANLKLEFPVHNRHQLTTGINTEYQHNKAGGWGFMLPAFRSANGGVFLHDLISINDKWTVNAGLRYDLGSIHTRAYHDWYLTPQEDGTNSYVQRAEQLARTYGNFSWGAGARYQNGSLTAKVNTGKSFRMPTAKELASNGINYHMYRYEKGDTTLNAEQSYQLDFGLIVKKEKWHAEFSPFVNYFPNYIYLNPTPEYYEAQQVYYYSQSKVFRTGGEVSAGYRLTPAFNLSADMEYIYSVQLSGLKKGYTLPFSPPLTSNIGADYTFANRQFLQQPVLGIELKLVAPQNKIAPPEKKTAGYALINLNAGTGVRTGKFNIRMNMQLNNLLNTRYYDHTSFYRLIEVPGQGRNFIITIQLSTI
jgi:iron complex outermembrane receptor protein